MPFPCQKTSLNGRAHIAAEEGTYWPELYSSMTPCSCCHTQCNSASSDRHIAVQKMQLISIKMMVKLKS